MISVLIADDEQPAIDELAFLLGQDPRVGVIHQASSGAEAIRLLTREPVDAAFLDIHMPGLTGFDLARALARFEHRPVLVFVTAISLYLTLMYTSLWFTVSGCFAIDDTEADADGQAPVA